MIISKNKYSEILEQNSKLSKLLLNEQYNIKVISNITTDQLNEILEYSLRANLIPAKVTSGNYDNLVQDSSYYNDCDVVIVFYELCNVFNGFYYKAELLDQEKLNIVVDRVENEIDLIMSNLEDVPLVLFNEFSSSQFTSTSIDIKKFDEISIKLNQYLNKNKQTNVEFVNIEKVFSELGMKKSLDMRGFYLFKALYSIDFYKVYVDRIHPIILAKNGKSRKVIIFDCDNTLWKGIVGEDGIDNIEMSLETSDGAIFAEVQAIALDMSKQGVLIGLCSKNNTDDVNDVITNHADMQLKDRYLSIKKIDWSSKAVNLKKISEELNVGLDSIVFVDDSSFEVNLIREQVPEVSVLQVPKKLYEYPSILREYVNSFFNLAKTKEDAKRVDMYKQQSKREELKDSHMDINKYLKSLDISIKIYHDIVEMIPRMAQLSQKSNQFNLTTKRYTENDFSKHINNNNNESICFSVTDKFGDSGVTGVCALIYNIHSKTAIIDSLFMSCRIIGRNIEYAFMDYLIEFLRNKKILTVKAEYRKTHKNKQVENFYDNCSFGLINSSNAVTEYKLDIKNYKNNKIDYIKVYSAPTN
jgi:FkbH-like protein